MRSVIAPGFAISFISGSFVRRAILFVRNERLQVRDVAIGKTLFAYEHSHALLAQVGTRREQPASGRHARRAHGRQLRAQILHGDAEESALLSAKAPVENEQRKQWAGGALIMYEFVVLSAEVAL